MNTLTLFDWNSILDHLLRLSAAALVGAALALHPLRWLGRWDKKPDWDAAKAQILITVAGAVIAVIVGDSLARAFGLVGVGSLVRFRTAMKSPRDTALFFLLIGMGMMCGIGLYGLAVLVTVFVFALLFALEITPRTDKGGKGKKAKRGKVELVPAPVPVLSAPARLDLPTN